MSRLLCKEANVGGCVVLKGDNNFLALSAARNEILAFYDGHGGRHGRNRMKVLGRRAGVLFHRRDLLEFTVVQTMDAVQQQQRQHNHERQNFRHPVSVLFRESRLPNNGIEFEGSHHLDYNGVDRILVFIEHLFDLRRIVPRDNTPFLVDLDGTLIIPKNQCSCGFCGLLTHEICCGFEVRNSSS